MDTNDKTKVNNTEEIEEVIKNDTNNNVEEMVDKVGDVTQEKETIATEANYEQQVGDEDSSLEESQLDEIESNIEKETGVMDSGEETPASKKPFNKKLLAIIVAIVVVVIAGIVINNIMQNKIVSIKAEYLGHEPDETKEGIVLDENNSLIIVTGKKKNGDTIEIRSGEWSVEEPKTLQMDQTSEIIIHYKNVETSLSVVCSTSAVTGIEVEYKGDTKEGVEINDESNFVVTRIHKNGSKDTTDDWHVITPVKLERDSTQDVEIEADGFTETVSIVCSTISVTKLEASYTGSIGEGAVLDNNNKGINVTAYYKNGTTERITNFIIKEPKTLQRGQKSTVTITYEDVSTELTVEACKAHMMDTTFKEIMDGFNNSDFYGMSIRTVTDESAIVGGTPPYTDEAGKKVTYIIDLNSGKEYKAYIYFTDYRTKAEHATVSGDLEVRDTDPINGIIIYLYDNSKDTYDSELAAVTLRLGEKIASLAGIEFDPTDMIENGHRQTNGQWQHVKYSKNGYDYFFESDDKSLATKYKYEFCLAVDQGIKGFFGYEYDIECPRQPE